MADRPGAEDAFLIMQRGSSPPLVDGASMAYGPWLSQRTVPIAHTLTITNIPAALTEINGGLSRLVIDTSFVSKSRLRVIVYTPANAGATARVQSSNDAGATWTTATATAVAIDAAGAFAADWSVIGETSDAFRIESLLFRAVTVNGDGATDPVITFLLEFR